MSGGVIVTEAPGAKQWRQGVKSRLGSLEQTIGQMRVENQVAGGNMDPVMEALKIPRSAIETVKAKALQGAADLPLRPRSRTRGTWMGGQSPSPHRPKNCPLP